MRVEINVHKKYAVMSVLEGVILLLGLILAARAKAAVVAYTEVNKKIFTPICSDCHSGASPAADMDLTNYDSVMKKGVVVPFKPEESLIVKKTVAGEMPMGGDPLKAEEIALLKEWIQGGAVKETPNPPPPATAVSYTEINKKIFTPICADCHSGSSPAANMDLTNYDSVMKKGVVVPFKPEESLIVKKTAAGEMPMGGDPLKPEEMALLKEWIKGGALNSAPNPVAALEIKSVTPRFGAPAGGHRIEIEGAGFSEGISVKIDERVCTEIKVVNATKLSCIVPSSNEPGKVTVKIELKGEIVTLDKGFEYRLPLGPTYAALFVNVFKPRCVGCHSGSNPPKSLDFSNYDSMMSHRRAIIPYDTKKSRAYKKVLEGEMPRGGPPLSSEQIQALGEWIRTGAKNN